MIVLDNSSKLTNNLEVKFSCLVHDLGKGTTPKEILPHHYGHEERGIELVQSLGKRIKIPNNWIKCGKAACKFHMKGGIFEQMTTKKQVDFIENVSKTILGLEGMKIIVMCDKSRNGEFVEVNFDKIGKEVLKKVTGKDIIKKYNITNGKEIKNRLRQERIKLLNDMKKQK